jgi:hypothetical protein
MWDYALAGLDVAWVGVWCDAAVTEARESARGDRAPGTARAQVELVHRGVRYDFEVDTTALDPQHATNQVVDHLTERWSLPRSSPTGDPDFYPLTSAWTVDGEIRPAPWERRPDQLD